MTDDRTKGHVRLFCLNLRFGLADDGPNNWENRKRAYPELLEKFPSDFYAFQEANDFQIEYLQNLLRDYDFIGQRRPAPDYWQNNVIFYHRRWECQSSEHFYLSDTPGVPSKLKGSRWPRQCTFGTFQANTFRLTVINTHFDFKPEVQRQSALLILKRLENTPPNLPVVLMGDLNAGPNSSCIAALTDKSVGFKSAFRPHMSGTHHKFQGVANGEPIDWILYRGGIEKKDSQIVTQPVSGVYPSDHFPLVASFKLRA